MKQNKRSQENATGHSDKQQSKVPVVKKPYQAPAWELEQIFEKMALGCAKADLNCIAGPIQS